MRTILVQLHLTCCIRHAVQIVTTEEYMEQIPLLIPKYYNLHTNVEYTHAALSGPTGRKAYINTEKKSMAKLETYCALKHNAHMHRHMFTLRYKPKTKMVTVFRAFLVIYSCT